jgi:hypothetical protein
MQLIAVRHAETEWNLAGSEMGQLDSPLTERGLAQAEALALRLANIPFDELYDLPFGASRGFAKSHASINRFEYAASGWRLDIWNDVTHLEDRATEGQAIAPGGELNP